MLFNFQGASRYRFSRQLCYYIKLKTLCQYFFQTFFKFFEVFFKVVPKLSAFRSSSALGFVSHLIGLLSIHYCLPFVNTFFQSFSSFFDLLPFCYHNTIRIPTNCAFYPYTHKICKKESLAVCEALNSTLLYRTGKLLRVMHSAAFANDIDLDLTGIFKLILDLLNDISCNERHLFIRDDLRLNHNTNLTACLDSK